MRWTGWEKEVKCTLNSQWNSNFSSLMVCSAGSAQARKFTLQPLTQNLSVQEFHRKVVLATFWGLHTSKSSHNKYVSSHSLVLAWSMILFVWLSFFGKKRHQAIWKDSNPVPILSICQTQEFVYLLTPRVPLPCKNNLRRNCWNTSFDIKSRKGRKNID